MSVPNWMPDWRDACQYPEKGKSLSGGAWAWEFLRRNPAYRLDYDAYSESIKSNGGSYEFENLTNALAVKYGFSIPIGSWRNNDGAIQIGHMPPPNAQSCPSLDVAHPVKGSMGVDWDDSGMASFESELYGETRDYKKAVLPLLQPNTIALSIDLSAPADVLELKIREFLAMYREAKGITPAKRRTHFAKMPIYLRVLDAKTCGAQDAEIAALLFPNIENDYPDYTGNKRVNSARSSATRIRDGDYRWLALDYKP